MKQWSLRIVCVAGLLALSWWGWGQLFPNSERIIRQRLAGLAEAAAVPANEAPLAGAVNSSRLTGFFSPDVSISIDLPGRSRVTFTGRDDMLKAVMGARSMLSGLKVEFLDVRVTVDADNQLATANLTARAKISGDSSNYIQELKITLKKMDGTWLITQIEGAKTLSLRSRIDFDSVASCHGLRKFEEAHPAAAA